MPETEMDNQAVVGFLQRTADINRRLHDFVVQLWKRPEVTTAQLFPFAPKGGIAFRTAGGPSDCELGSDFGVSAELGDGSVIDWWLELWWNSKCWRVECTIFRHDPDEDGCHPIVGFPLHEVTGVDGALATVSRAIDDLFSAEPPHLFDLSPQKAYKRPMHKG
jgi:hypothetical protein